MLVNNLGFYSYAIACLGFLILGCWIFASRNASRPGRLIAISCLVNAIWAGCASLAASKLALTPVLLAVFEPLHTVAWILAISLIPVIGQSNAAANQELEDEVTRWRRLAFVIASAGLSLSLAADFMSLGERLSFAAKISLSVFGLVAVEQLFRNTPFDSRWSIKLLCIALIALFAFDIVMYSDALMFGQLNYPWWIARGFASLAVIPLIALTLSRTKNWGIGLALSRSVAFHSAALLVSGAYLLIISLAAYWVGSMGGGWGVVLQTTITFLALLSLVLMLFSGKVRAWLRVTVYKNFFKLRYDYREEWHKFTRELTLSSNSETIAERSLRALADLVQANSRVLYLRSDDGSYHQIVSKGLGEHGDMLPPKIISPTESLIVYLQSKDWVISAQEFAANPAIYDGLNLPAWCANLKDTVILAPLRVNDQLLGIALLCDLRVPLEVDWEVRDILKAMGRQAASYLAQEEAVKALLVARQFESFNRMSAFVVHDLKNLVAQLSLMLANAEKHKHNPEFQDDMISTSQNVMDRMRGLLLQLRAGTKPIEAPEPVSLNDAIRGAISAKPGLKAAPKITHEYPGELLVKAHSDRLERVIGHLIQNASEAISADGRIEVITRRLGNDAQVLVRDNGKGMSQEFISLHLFKPFESTKAHGMGIGAFESREYIRELGGRLEVESSLDKGTCFTISLAIHGHVNMATVVGNDSTETGHG